MKKWQWGTIVGVAIALMWAIPIGAQQGVSSGELERVLNGSREGTGRVVAAEMIPAVTEPKTVIAIQEKRTPVCARVDYPAGDAPMPYEDEHLIQIRPMPGMTLSRLYAWWRGEGGLDDVETFIKSFQESNPQIRNSNCISAEYRVNVPMPPSQIALRKSNVAMWRQLGRVESTANNALEEARLAKRQSDDTKARLETIDTHQTVVLRRLGQLEKELRERMNAHGQASPSKSSSRVIPMIRYENQDYILEEAAFTAGEASRQRQYDANGSDTRSNNGRGANEWSAWILGIPYWILFLILGLAVMSGFAFFAIRRRRTTHGHNANSDIADALQRINDRLDAMATGSDRRLQTIDDRLSAMEVLSDQRWEQIQDELTELKSLQPGYKIAYRIPDRILDDVSRQKTEDEKTLSVVRGSVKVRADGSRELWCGTPCCGTQVLEQNLEKHIADHPDCQTKIKQKYGIGIKPKPVAQP